MRKSTRAALGVCAALTMLAFANAASAAYTSPKLVVASLTPGGAGGGIRIGAVVSQTDDPTAKVQIYIPNGYQVAAATAGAKLGDVTATAQAGPELANTVLPLTGSLLAIDPSTLTASQKAGVAQCLQGASASQTWDLRLTAAGQTLDVPVSVVAASAGEVQLGYQAKLVICLPPPDVPTSDPRRAQFGAKLLSASFGVSAITQPGASGDYRWTSLWTPYNPGVGTVNAAGTVETQSLQHVPTLLKLNVTKKKLVSFKRVVRHGKRVRVRVVRTRVTFSTAVTENGAPATGAKVTTTLGGKSVGGASGSFILTAKSATLTARASVNRDVAVPTGQTASPADLFYRDLGAVACTKTAGFGGLPCVDATVGGSALSASTVVRKYLR